eukprot:scaffold282228_cov15-Tisochrysis_lutea.AAC.1
MSMAGFTIGFARQPNLNSQAKGGSMFIAVFPQHDSRTPSFLTDPGHPRRRQLETSSCINKASKRQRLSIVNLRTVCPKAMAALCMKSICNSCGDGTSDAKVPIGDSLRAGEKPVEN